MAGSTGVTVRSASSSVVGASLRDHVVNVVLHRPQEQVIRTDARRVVTPVADEQAGWDRAEVDLPRDAVGQFETLVCRADTDDAVALRQMVRRPCPATGRLLNLGPEANCQRNRASGDIASSGAELRGRPTSLNRLTALGARSVAALALPGVLTRSGAVGALPLPDSGRLQGEGRAAVGAGESNTGRILPGHREASLPGVSPGVLAHCRGTLRSSILPDWGTQ
jgi:hypothetical protein